MKNIKGTILYFMMFAMLVASCKQKKKDENLEGELKIYADTNLAVLLDQFIPVFENIYPNIQIKFVYKYEDEILQDYFDNKTDNIILSRRLSENEVAYANQHKASESSQFTFAYDAIAVFTNKNNQDSIFNTSKYTTYQMVFDNSKSGIAKVVMPDTIQKVAANLIQNFKDMQSFIVTNQAIGFVQFSNISNKNIRETNDFYNQYKLLKVKSGQDVFELNQEAIFQSSYPFMRQLTIISTQSMTSKQKLFSRFLFKSRASKLILHHGIVPAKIPSIEINMIDRNFQVEP
ncbi:MAG: substrate-binding domain-containing protein [Sphingobacteriales bacterium]|jgi:ABC-type phosphate transport system substrate-binding protein|nr:MAG: substrate-binding domain-containing protein [Sphingobacteriales bacterium]